MSQIHDILKKHWGYDQFRPLQEDIIQSVMSGKDTLALLPTGGGKSICFQVPGIALEGVCIVVSPLIALMKDQVHNLKKAGVKAEAIYSGLHKKTIDIILDNCIYGDVKFLYVSPERLQTELFRERLKKMKVGLLAVDEAHCISQWGYDFRPPYIQIAEIRELMPKVPCMALTASATQQVCADIQEKLRFNNKTIFRKSFSRENLSYSVFETEAKFSRLLEILNKVPGTAVVYMRSRKKTKEIADFLSKNGVSADYYHAGLASEVRSKKQDDWINDKIRVIVSTNAFGMGIDKPDVRLVIHLEIPPDLESYYQEAGRGGRDGKIAYAVMLYDKNDIRNLEEQLEQQHPEVKTIVATYLLLTEYFRLAEGSFTEESYDFKLSDFTEKYKLNPVVTYQALVKLENQSLISLTENANTQSELMLSIDDGELLRFQQSNAVFGPILEILLRMYGGELFERPLRIHESKIATELEISEDQVIDLLTKLHERKFLVYTKVGSVPKMTFLTGISKKGTVGLNTAFLKLQKDNARVKMNAVVNYTTNNQRCRTQMILEYFDEITDQTCGNCDYCKAKKKTLSSAKHAALKNLILSTLSENEKSLSELLSISKYDRTILGEVLQELLDVGHIALKNDKYVLKK